MRNGLPLLLLGVLAALASAGCGSSTPTSPLGAGPAVTNPAVAPQAWSGAVVLGRAGETSGKISSQTSFAAQDLIEARVDVGGTPPDVEVKATWLDGHGHVLGSEAHRTRSSQETMVFASPSPRGLDPGHYQVQLSVGGQLVWEQSFEIESASEHPAGNGEKSGASRPSTPEG